MTEADKAKIEGRVAQIVSAREVAINLGLRDGVIKGMKFAILSDLPMEVRDPETQELLDVIDREKVRVEAAEVRERITICRTFRKKYIPGGGLASASFFQMQKLMEPPRTVIETLAVKDSQVPPPLDPEDSFVQINDRVIQIDDQE